ncbi:MAG: hypothetical protein JSU94_00305 [Phycisphaerales bacterium]|nr:MAG: hypothetical protein JSU94_00305 [Phycisphaerales bacterium]
MTARAGRFRAVLTLGVVILAAVAADGVAYEANAHRWIVGKALECYAIGGSSSEPYLFLAAISNGAYNEDKGDGYGTSEDHIFNYLCDGAAIATCTYPHFWDYDGDNGLSGAGADDIVVVASDNWPNAWMKVSGYRVSQFGNPPRSPEGYGLWQEALLNYRLNGLWNAYERLGHICHLLADMSVPAHVHEDLHPTSDHYEDTISDNITAVLTYLDRTEFTRGMIPIPGHLSAGFDPEMFPLFYLMYTTNQRADFFASEDDWGDALDWLAWVDYSTWPGAYFYYQDRRWDEGLSRIRDKIFGLGGEIGAMFYVLPVSDNQPFNLALMPFARIGVGFNWGDFSNIPALGRFYSGDLGDVRFEVSGGVEARLLIARLLMVGIGAGVGYWNSFDVDAVIIGQGGAIIGFRSVPYDGLDAFLRLTIGVVF